LLPSKRTKDWEELFGMVIIEAMACGCIPICSDHNGPKIILNKTSWHKNLIKEDDYTVEANKLLQRYTNDLVLFNEDKRMAIETAAAYGKKTIAAIWHSVFIKAGRKK
ncbi:TPA: glycosyltransferase family 4 protein, partial [Klebsiella pneumoniae]|nr:glycosyltransferase family 4 protein [Klebsiella pneumoniae]